ncbi:MAG: PorP/SprF family type IX secretion system membrane protein [Bacteroidales bacterium]|nr:PorP/SprF family type IX secretion system membrane protein [Bacteroidales bacterium]
MLLLVGLLCFFNSISAQNYHFSQFYTQPISLNPALTGAFDGIVRGNITQRTQWLSVTEPFLTIGADVDGAIYKNNRRQELIGIGANFNADKAGDVAYTSYQAMVSLSYIKYIGRQNRHKIGLGFYGGFINNVFDYYAAHWDEQYQNGAFDPHYPASDIFDNTKQFFFDCGAGLFWSFTPNKTNTFQLGASASHLNRPVESFRNSSSRLPIKYSAHFISKIGLTRTLALEPMAYAAWQRKFSEYAFGCNIEYFQKKNSYTTVFSLGGGLFYRWNDAIVADLFFDWQNLRLAVCYDFNASPWIIATHMRGGFEVSLSYIFRRKTVTRLGKEPCPYDLM